MRTHINLSTRPFTNRRLFWIGVVAVYFVGFWFLLWMMAEKNRVLAKQNEIKQRIESQKQAADQAKIEHERRKKEAEQVVLTDEQKIQLAAARQLVERKTFSWNRMIGDIEEYVPKKARIISIKVDEIVNSGEGALARLQVKAAGATPDEMTEMMVNLEKSGGRFGVGEAQQDATLESGETPFTLNLTYKPLRGAAR